MTWETLSLIIVSRLKIQEPQGGPAKSNSLTRRESVTQKRYCHMPLQQKRWMHSKPQDKERETSHKREMT